MFKKGSYFYYALGNGMFYFSWGMFGGILSIYLSSIGCQASEVSLISSASAIFAIATQPLAGLMADKLHSPKKVTVYCSILVIFFGMMFAYSKNIILLFLFNGATQGLMNGIMALTDRLATSAPYPYGTIRFWGSSLYALSCQLSGIIFENISPMANFYLFGIGMILTVISYINVYDNTSKKEIITSKISTKDILIDLSKNKPYRMFVIIYMIFQGSLLSQAVILQLMMKDLGASTSLIGTMLFLSTLSELPMVLFSDKIIKKFSYKTLMIFACVVSLIRYLWYSTCPLPNHIAYIFFFQGATGMVFMMVVVRIILDLTSEQYVNTAFGIANMLAKGLATVAFQLISGRIAEYFGYTIIYYVYVFMMIIAIGLCFKFKMPTKK